MLKTRKIFILLLSKCENRILRGTLVVEILLISLSKASRLEVLKYEYILIKTGSDVAKKC